MSQSNYRVKNENEYIGNYFWGAHTAATGRLLPIASLVQAWTCPKQALLLWTRPGVEEFKELGTKFCDGVFLSQYSQNKLFAKDLGIFES